MGSHGKLPSSEFLMLYPPCFVAYTEAEGVFSSKLPGHSLNVCASLAMIDAKGCCYTAALNFCDVFQPVN